MTVIWLPKLEEIKGDNTIRNAWDVLRKKLKNRTKITIGGYENPIEWIVVIQQHDHYSKAIVMEKVVFTRQHMEHVKKRIPEAIHDPEIRITWWEYKNGKWEPSKEIEEARIVNRPPPLIPLCDFDRLCRIYNYLKLYNSIPEQERLEPLDL